MLCVGMKPLDAPGNRAKRISPNPLECPPSLTHSQYQQHSFGRRLSEGSETNACFASGDFLQHQTSADGGSSFSERVTFQPNNLNANTRNLREQLLSSLASQIMSQRPMVMNYNLPNSQQQSLATNVGGETVKAMALGSSQAMLALANKKGVANRNNQVGFQKATCTRVPCHARGMSTDHNALTAFLEIPNDAVHGLHLLCSHPTCRAVGVKFRYCYFCKKPVTKQNFRSRHLHADLAEKEKNKTSAAQPMMPPLPPNSTETMCFPTSAPPSPPLALQQPSNPTLFVGNSEVNISPRSNLQSLIDAANANQRDLGKNRL